MSLRRKSILMSFKTIVKFRKKRGIVETSLGLSGGSTPVLERRARISGINFITIRTACDSRQKGPMLGYGARITTVCIIWCTAAAFAQGVLCNKTRQLERPEEMFGCLFLSPVESFLNNWCHE